MPIYVYECPVCRKVTEVSKPMCEVRPGTIPCQKCGRPAERSFRLEQGHMRQGDLPDWESVNAGVMPDQVPQANREYAHLGVTFDPRTGNAHVPGNRRREFLRERGLVEL